MFSWLQFFSEDKCSLSTVKQNSDRWFQQRIWITMWRKRHAYKIPTMRNVRSLSWWKISFFLTRLTKKSYSSIWRWLHRSHTQWDHSIGYLCCCCCCYCLPRCCCSVCLTCHSTVLTKAPCLIASYTHRHTHRWHIIIVSMCTCCGPESQRVSGILGSTARKMTVSFSVMMRSRSAKPIRTQLPLLFPFLPSAYLPLSYPFPTPPLPLLPFFPLSTPLLFPSPPGPPPSLARDLGRTVIKASPVGPGWAPVANAVAYIVTRPYGDNWFRDPTSTRCSKKYTGCGCQSVSILNKIHLRHD